MSFLNPFREVPRGLATYWRGVHWLRKHPRYLRLLAVPWLVGALFFGGSVTFFALYEDRLLARLSLRHGAVDPWWATVLYYGGGVVLFLAISLAALLVTLVVMNVVASPIYEAVSLAVERDLTGQEPPQLSLRSSFRVMVVEGKKVALILALSIILLLIPGLGVISPVLAAFLVGWDFFDYPLARRGWTLRERLRFVTGEFWSVLGFGLWLVIPFFQIFLLPLAVAGGTILNLEALERARLRQLIERKEEA